MGTALVDMNTAIGRAVYQGNGEAIVNKFNGKYKKKLEEYLKELINNRKELEDLFEDMRINMEKFALTAVGFAENFRSEDIISRIYDVINYIDRDNLDYKKINLAELLQQTKVDSTFYNSKLKLESIQKFIDKYFDVRDKFLDVSEEVGASSQIIRNDTAYYGILLSNVYNKDLKTQQSHLLKITREQFEQFERQNLDLFELSVSRLQPEKGTEYYDENGNKRRWRWSGREGRAQTYGLRKDVSAQQVYERMLNTFGQEANVDILDTIYAFNPTTKQAIRTREVFNLLNDNTLINNKQGSNFDGLGGGRRLEILFDPKLRKEVSSMLQANNLTTTLTKKNLASFLNNSTQFDTSKYRGSENVYGNATGDVNFNFGFGDEAWQLKFKGASSPWHGLGYQGQIDSLRAMINLCDTVKSDPQKILNIGENGGALFNSEADAVAAFESNSRAMNSLQEMGVEQIQDDFLSYNWDEYTEVYLS